MGEVILVALAFFGAALLIAVFAGVSIVLGFGIRAIKPGINRLFLSFLAAGAVPLGWLTLLIVAALVAIDGEFRGPEVLGFAVLTTIVVIWPANIFTTYRFFRNR